MTWFIWIFNLFFAFAAIVIFFVGLSVVAMYVWYWLRTPTDAPKIERALAEKRRTRFR